MLAETSAGSSSDSGTARPKIGIQLPTTDGFGVGVGDVGAVARAAEAGGFDSVWVGDHFSFHAPVIESIVAASVAAAVTDTVEIGFGVLLPAMRHPGWLAKQLSSLQAISRDRLVLGIGVGGEFPSEWEAVGVPVQERGARTDAFLAAAPSLLTGQATALGSPWNVTIPRLLPAGRMPSLWIGGRSDAALRRAVRFGADWLGVWMDEAEIARCRTRLFELAADANAPAPAIGCSVMLHLDRDPGRAHDVMARYMEAIYGIPYARLQPYTIAGDEDVAVERLTALIAAGASSIVLLPTERDSVFAVEQLAVVAQRVRNEQVVAASDHP